MIIALLMLPMMIGFAALAVEAGLWYADKHELRAMADAAAVAAAWARKEDTDEADAATDAVSGLGFDADLDEIDVNSPPEDGAYEGSADAIEVVITRTRGLVLSTLFIDDENINIVVRAVANLSPVSLGESCILALSTTADSAIDVSGNGGVSLSGCGVTANSSSATAVTVTGSGTLGADYLAAVGDYTVQKPADSNIGEFATGVDLVTDPWGTFTPSDMPDDSDCDYSSTWTSSNNGASPPAGSVFCDGLTIKHEIVLESGTYYITGGSLYFTANADITANGPVTFVLTDDATVDIRGGASINLEAPTSGEFKGLLFFSDSTDTDTIKINGGATMNLDGALYFRNQDLEFKGNSGLAGGCLKVIAQTVSFGGDSGLGSDCGKYDMPSMGASVDMPTLVE